MAVGQVAARDHPRQWRGARDGEEVPARGRGGDTVRMAPTPPGEVAEMDFERLGLLRDPETGRRQWIWGLSITLTYSRHSFLWPLVHQTVEAIIEGLRRHGPFFFCDSIRI